MYIEALKRELVIRGQAEAESLIKQEPGKWNVISIREPFHPEPVLANCRSIYSCVFEDVQTEDGNHGHGPKSTHVESVLRAVDRAKTGPLLVHCWAGRSRSTAIGLLLIVRALWEQGIDGAALVRDSVETLLAIRPQAIPNSLVLRLGLQLIVPSPLAGALSRNLLAHPALVANRDQMLSSTYGDDDSAL